MNWSEYGVTDPALSQDAEAIRRTTTPPRKRRGGGDMVSYGVLALLGLGGVIVVLLCTSRYGVGTSSDSAGYLSAARSLLAGRGFRYPDGRLCAQWPPLYPTLLAATGLAGVDPLSGARLLNSLAFGGLAFLSGILVARCTASGAWAVAGSLAVLSASPLLACYLMAWSEPVFILLAVLFVLCMPGFLRRQSLPVLLLVSTFAGLACLQRYVGVTLILTGFVLIALSPYRTSLLRRLMYVVVFGILSATPVALWCVRNHLLVGQSTGAHQPRVVSGPELLHALRIAGEIVASWLRHPARVGSVRPVSLALLVGLASGLIVWSHVAETVRSRRRNHSTSGDDRRDTGGLQVWSAAVFGLVYFGFVVVSAAGLTWDPEERHLAPVYVFLLALAVAGIDGAGRLLSLRLGHAQLVRSVSVFLCALWLVYPLRELRHTIRYCVRQGAGGYSTSTWQDSSLLGWFRAHPLPGGVYSNAPDALYLLAGVPAATTPYHHWDATEFAQREFSARPGYVVWFFNRRWPFLYDLRELLSRYQMEEVAAFPDGCVYRFVGMGGPGVSAVYRFHSPESERHLYTIRKAERDRLCSQGGTWVYEGPAFYVFPPDGRRPPDTRPVYEMRPARSSSCFYTMNEAEKDRLLRDPAGAWTCPGVAFYAWPQAGAKEAIPVYRFWSEQLNAHFYTADESERAALANQSDPTWTYERIAWYAGGP